jgi:hypothetical protein
MWLNKLKAAVVMRDVTKVSELLDDVPTLTKSELEQASHLLNEAAKIATELRDETALSMEKVRKNIRFLAATESKRKQGFDITL